MIFKRNKNKILVLIIVLASILRFYRLDSYPALNADEAAIGYNAYSLIQTGKDEHGNAWPIHFQSFNDYKPGLYFYLVAPFVATLGLSEWAVRIPSALLGVATVLTLYFLVKELFSDGKLALIAALFLAISPWHIHFSRGGWEVNVATFFITLGVWLFVKAAKDPKFYVCSFLAFAASLYTYHAARIVVPFLGLGLVVIYYRFVRKDFKKVVVGAFVGLIILLPLAKDLLGGGVFSRAAGVGLFADTGPKSRIEEQRGEHGDISGFPSKFFHNKVVNYGLVFLQNWSEHYWGEFLFLSGDEIQRNRVPETGQMYMVEAVFVAAGVIAIIKNFRREWALVLLCLIVAPIGAALTFQSPHALRAHNMMIPLVIISAYGLVTILRILERTKTMRSLGYIALAVILLCSFGRYQHMYWVHMAKEYPFSSQYGVKELVEYVKNNQEKYQKVIVTDRYDQPYILFLFYLKYPPQKFQTEHALTPRDEFGFSTVNSFGKYYFSSIKYDQVRPENPNTLIVGTDGEIPDEANVVKEIYGTNGYKYFDVVAN